MLISKRVADLMKNHPKAQGKTQNEIAAEMGIASSVLTKLLSVDDNKSKSKNPSSATICAIADYFDVSTDYILGRTEIRTADPATKDICDALGLWDEAVIHLRDDGKFRDVINFLFTQHDFANAHEPVSEGEKMLGSSSSILQNFKEFIDLILRPEDVFLAIKPDGKLLFAYSEDDFNRTVQSNLEGIRFVCSLMTVAREKNISQIDFLLKKLSKRTSDNVFEIMTNHRKESSDETNT